MRFSEHGPDFPPALLDALLAGEVIFVCGAGVSAPQLPGFHDLVARVVQKLGVPLEGGELAAMEAGRYEEVLGSLARRLVHESRMYDAVASILSVPAAPDIAQHRTLLRLSRDLDNRYCLVTTNFDPLFERAVAADHSSEFARRVSVAGQALPAPGSEPFSGVIHLHGRLADVALDLDRTPLVLTSAEYGDAYMRSGWASRFLFDLARCKALVLIGYSASDAPVRYFLNVLQADRERFTDLRQVYAFDAVEHDDLEAEARWSLVAVEPIPYRRQVGIGSPHSALWDDLAQLADVVERPKSARQRRTREILANPFAESTPEDRADLEWLIKDKGDLWDVAISSIEDPAWIDYFSEASLWRAEDPRWFIPQWVRRGWSNISRLHAAARWCATPDAQLSTQIEFDLGHPSVTLSPVWRRAWHLLAQGNLERIRLRGENAYSLAQALQRTPRLDLDIRRGVDALTPHLAIEAPRWRDDPFEGEPTRLVDLFRASLSVGPDHEVDTITVALVATGEIGRISELATDALRSTVATAIDAELLEEGQDYLDNSVPSVEPHPQNEYRDGVIHLVGLLVRLLPDLANVDREAALQMTEAWRRLPTRLGARMWLHALRNGQLYNAGVAIQELLSLSEDDFWAHRREVIKVLSERTAGAEAAQIDALVARIDCEGPLLFGDLPPRDGETDWRPYARDHAMWVRLMALDAAGALTPDGRSLLEAIRERTPHLKRKVEESDLFSSYMGEVRDVVGDPVPLLEADPDERLDVAHRLVQSGDFEQRIGWSAYCRADPVAALETLTQHGFRPQDVDLWRDLINAIALPAPKDTLPGATRAQLVASVFRSLEEAPQEALENLTPTLVGLFYPHDATPVRVRRTWWDRLWTVIDHDGASDNDATEGRFLDRVINSPAGKLAEDLLRTIELERKARGRPTRANLQRLRTIMRSPNRAGHQARGVCARSVGFLIYIDEPLVRRHFLPRLGEDSLQGATLRAVICEWSQLGADATRVVRGELIRGAIESTASDTMAQRIAAKLLSPCLSPRVTKEVVVWGFDDDDAAHVLKQCGDNIRIGAALCLSIWQSRATDPGPADLWARGTRPMFDAIWPQERKFKHRRISGFLARCATQTGECFPEAVETFRPYFTNTVEGPVSLEFLANSDVPTRFPAATLDLLWAVLRSRHESVGTPFLATALDQIKAAAPEFETDRRLQWLETISLRFA